MKQFSVLGSSPVKVDTVEKVLGAAKFAADYTMPDMLWGGVFRSTIPHGIIKRLDLEKARAMPGVVCVLDHTAIPGQNRFGIIIKDEPCLVDDKVRRYGDAIALVAAETREQLLDALEAIEVEYEELEPVFTIERAMEADAPIVHGKTNVHATKLLDHGDVDAAWEKCDVIVENTYSTHRLSHMFIEPEAGISYYDEQGMLNVVVSTQNPHYDRDEVAKLLNLPSNQVRVKQATTGGGFGGKLDISVQLHCALLTYYTRRPVKIVRSRRESTMVSSKRHPMTMKCKTGATKDGKLVAVDVTMTGDTGAYASYGPAVIGRAPVHIAGPYECPNVRCDAVFYYTNNPMSGAFRGFGVPQAAVCHEGQMNALAKALGMDPIELRRRNAHKVGTVIPTGQQLTESVGFADTLQKAVEKADEVMGKNLPKPGSGKKRGRGIGCMWYGVGNTGLPNPSAAFVEVLGDCTVNLMVGCADIGQGSSTVMAQIAAETLGLRYEDIHVTWADTAVTPEGGATSASRQTFVSGNAVKNACTQALGELKCTAAEKLDVPERELVFRDREVCSKENPEKKLSYPDLMAAMKRAGRLAVGAGYYNPKTTYLDPKDMSGVPYEVYSYGTTICEVDVDTETGEVDVLQVVSAHDVGTPVNLLAVEGQIEGGVAMGEGFALFENIEVDKKTGAIKNPIFSKYIIPTNMDVPEIYPIVVSSEGEAAPFGAKGVGEPALIPMIPAAISAVENAIGCTFTSTPILPKDIVAAVREKEAAATKNT